MNLLTLEILLQELVGEAVVQKSIVGNSMLLWLSRDPKSANAKCISVEPPWRIEANRGIEATSLGFPQDSLDNETEAQYRARFEVACAASNVLEGCVISHLAIDHVTGDLILQFRSGYTLRTFSIDLAEANWHYSDYALNTRYEVMVTGASTQQLNDVTD